MKTLFALVLSLGLLAVAASAAPAITNITNAASFSLSPLPNSSIAQGSFFAIFGSGLGSPTSGCGANLTDCIWKPYPLPTTIKGATVNISAGGTNHAAYLYFAIDSQINAVVPSDVPTGSAQVTVTYNGGTSAPVTVTIVASSFGTFALNQGGTGPGIITDAKYAVLTPTHTAKPGDAVILWGTGLGASPDVANEANSGPCPTGCDFRSGSFGVNVFVGNQPAKVDYAGRAPGYTAEDEIVFEVPAGVQGCYVNVAVQAGPTGSQVVSNFTSMTVDPAGGACSDADGINMSDLVSAISSKGKASVGVVSMLSNYLSLNLLGTPLQWDNDTLNGEIGTFSTTVLNEFQGFTLAPSVNNCTVSPFQGFPPPSDPALASVTYLDTGASIGISGPNGSKTVTKNSNGKGYGTGNPIGGSSISDLLSGGGGPPYFLNSSFAIVPGTYTITSPGGTDVGAISGQIPVSQNAANFKWTNQTDVTKNPIPRNQPLTITWTGGDSNGFVNITAIGSTTNSLVPSSTTPGVLVECMAPASAGTFTVPTFVLQSLPSTASSSSPVAGEILVGPSSGAVKLGTVPSGLDAAYAFYHFIQGAGVVWQ
ncbi:MAG: hypothetical protein U0Q18_16765 [Bryobacteraceae bacterium]